MSQPVPPERLDFLDSMRGLAAATVVAHHCLITLPICYDAYFRHFLDRFGHDQPPTWLEGLVYLLAYTPVHLLWGGQEAVIFFFVLSGFVLTLPFAAGRAPGAVTFVMKRMIRLYPPYLVAVGMAMGLALLIGKRTVPGTSAWVQSLWHAPLTRTEITNHLLMFGELNKFNSVVWSLVPEVLVSFIFPALMILVLRSPAVISLGLALFLATDTFRTMAWGQVSGYAWLAQPAWFYINTLMYLQFFVAGALVARYKDRIGGWLGRVSPTGRIGLTILAAYLLNHRWQMPFFLKEPMQLEAIGACLILALCLHRPPAFLRHPWLVWLGHRSFSLYLVHEMVLLTLVFGLYRWLPLWVLIAAMPPIALGLAHVFHRWVELPSIAAGRWVAAALGSGRAAGS